MHDHREPARQSNFGLLTTMASLNAHPVQAEQGIAQDGNEVIRVGDDLAFPA